MSSSVRFPILLENCLRWLEMQAQPEKQGKPMAVIDKSVNAAAQYRQLAVATCATLERGARCAVLFQPRDQ